MEKKQIINHVKGRRHVGKTDWERVQKSDERPAVDSENPELAYKPGKIFAKPKKN
ncbi:MAG: hypothetical protein AB1810_01980 [Pseudomonadota bacterium]